MIVRLLLLCWFILSIYSCSNSQKKNNDAEIISKTLNDYNEVVLRNDFNAMIDFIYPELFKQFSKEEMINDAKSGMNNNDYEITLNKIYTDSISDVYNSGLNK